MKKQWISVKCGLSRDPKHRRRMGKSIWTFLHMLDLADWETGIIYDWKDESAAEDMGIDIRVLREDRRKLQEEDYITCTQKQHGQDIKIINWTNPREYSGQVYNKKVSPSDIQGDAQGDAQGSVKDVTPTYSSNIKVQIKDKAAKTPIPPEVKIYREVTGRYPNRANYPDVEKIIQSVSARLGRDAVKDDLLPYFTEWTARGYNPANLSGWTSWAVVGSIPSMGKPVQSKAMDTINQWLQSKAGA